MHSLCMLLICLSELLVESGQVRRTRRAVAGVPFSRRQPRRSYCRAAGRPRRSISTVSLSLHSELRRCVPQGITSRRRHQQDQGDDGSAQRLIGCIVLAQSQFRQVPRPVQGSHPSAGMEPQESTGAPGGRRPKSRQKAAVVQDWHVHAVDNAGPLNSWRQIPDIWTMHCGATSALRPQTVLGQPKKQASK